MAKVDHCSESSFRLDKDKALRTVEHLETLDLQRLNPVFDDNIFRSKRHLCFNINGESFVRLSSCNHGQFPISLVDFLPFKRHSACSRKPVWPVYRRNTSVMLPKKKEKKNMQVKVETMEHQFS